MISKIYNCISIHNGGGIVYLSMMHTEIDRKGNLILLDYRAKNHLLPFLHAEIKFFKSGRFDVYLNKGIIIKYPIKFNKKMINYSSELLNRKEFTNSKVIDLRIKNKIIKYE